MTRRALLHLAAIGAVSAPGGAPAQNPPPGPEPLRAPVTVTFVDTPIREVLFTFAEFADRSIVPGAEVDGILSAEIRNQPWDVALRALLEAHGLVFREDSTGIILVEQATRLFEREAVLPLRTEVFPASWTSVGELHEMALPLLSERGRASAGFETNTLVVTDIPRILGEVGALVEAVDRPVRQVDIAAKIVFVNRTELEGLGITYDFKDLEGNQLNLLNAGAKDLDGDGKIDLTEESVPTGADVVALGGNSIAALGNATNRVAGPTLSLLTTLVAGRHTLVGFIDALESAQLTEVEAQPSVRVMDNRTARVVVGEETPVRVLDAGAQSQSGGEGGVQGAFPVATVDYKETGVILEVTPRIAAENRILLELAAERSSADIAPSDVGFVFRRQKAESRILVESGETVAIGGLTVTELGEVRSGIPLLMDLPLLGWLFRSRRESAIRRELLVMVTPTIVGDASP